MHVCSNPILRGDGCWNVYLDVGSNIGVQVRKLFEPRVYRRARAQRVYSQFFGTTEQMRREHTCAFGVEANPRHAARLQRLQSRYNELGWRTQFLTSTAAGTNGSATTTFWLDNSGDPLAEGTEWWASTLQHAMQRGNGTKWQAAIVQTVDLAQWLGCILNRKLPPPPFPVNAGLKPPRVVMKLDIEGGALCCLHMKRTHHLRNPSDLTPHVHVCVLHVLPRHR